MTQSDLPVARAQLDDFEFTVLAQPEAVLHVLSVFLVHFGNVAESFDAFVELDKNPERSVANDAAANDIADDVACEELLPDVRLKLFDPERQAMVFRIDVQDDRLDPFTFLQNFGRVLDPARRNVGNVNQAV